MTQGILQHAVRQFTRAVYEKAEQLDPSVVRRAATALAEQGLPEFVDIESVGGQLLLRPSFQVMPFQFTRVAYEEVPGFSGELQARFVDALSAQALSGFVDAPLVDLERALESRFGTLIAGISAGPYGIEVLVNEEEFRFRVDRAMSSLPGVQYALRATAEITAP